jgi:hypothetical protein
MACLAKITEAGYQVEVQWECEFVKGILLVHPELEAHPIVLHEPLNTRDALYGVRTEAIRLHYKAAEGETIQYLDVMFQYPYICKYFKFPIGHPVIRAGDDCADTDAMLQIDGLMKCRFAAIIGCYSVCVDLVLYSRAEPRTARMKRMLKGH